MVVRLYVSGFAPNDVPWSALAAPASRSACECARDQVLTLSGSDTYAVVELDIPDEACVQVRRIVPQPIAASAHATPVELAVVVAHD